MSIQISLIGYGAIARDVMRRVADDPQLSIAQVLVRPGKRSEVAADVSPDVEVICNSDDIRAETSLVVECAGHEAVGTHVPPLLLRGLDVAIVSAGALADPARYDALMLACEKGHSTLTVLPGAIGGIDALAAAGEDLDHVSYTSRKPPLSWSGTPAEATHDLAALTEATEIFAGSAREAATDFPKNANVVATVALAGIGFDATRVSLMADPEATGNTHAITAKGPRFELHYTTSGAALPENPKTSALTSASVARALRARRFGLTL